MSAHKQLLVALLLILSSLSLKLAAQTLSELPRGFKPPNVHHVGDVWLRSFASVDTLFTYGTVLVHMNPGAYLNWHSHPGGQQLLFTAGRGLYQERGGPIQVMCAGDLIRCQPNVEHWHAATPSESVGYLAMSGPGATQWAEPINASLYASLNVDSLARASTGEELLQLSRDKWRWMAEKDTAQLATLFHPEAQFVHMGGTWGTERELDIIGSGGIHYKKADIHEASVEVLGDDMAIVYNRITLLAEVGGNDATNPFMVTEVYQAVDGEWRLANLSFVKVRG